MMVWRVMVATAAAVIGAGAMPAGVQNPEAHDVSQAVLIEKWIGDTQYIRGFAEFFQKGVDPGFPLQSDIAGVGCVQLLEP